MSKFNPVVTKQGSTGDVVAFDQMLLDITYKNPNPKDVDGKYKPQTAREVLAFQKEYNTRRALKSGDEGYLLEDGKIGNYDQRTAGTGTREALIRRFQESMGLPADGKMSPDLFEKMVTEYNGKSETNDGNLCKLTQSQMASVRRGALVIGATGSSRPEPERGSHEVVKPTTLSAIQQPGAVEKS